LDSKVELAFITLQILQIGDVMLMQADDEQIKILCCMAKVQEESEMQARA
jgi:hypothetical protein